MYSIYMVQSKKRRKKGKGTRKKKGGNQTRERWRKVRHKLHKAAEKGLSKVEKAIDDFVNITFFDILNDENLMSYNDEEKFKNYKFIWKNVKATKEEEKWYSYLKNNKFKNLPNLPEEINYLPRRILESTEKFLKRRNKGRRSFLSSFRSVRSAQPAIQRQQPQTITRRRQQHVGCPPGTFRMSGSFEEGAKCEKVGPNTRYASYNPNTGRQDPNLMNVPNPDEFMSELPLAVAVPVKDTSKKRKTRRHGLSSAEIAKITGSPYTIHVTPAQAAQLQGPRSVVNTSQTNIPEPTTPPPPPPNVPSYRVKQNMTKRRENRKRKHKAEISKRQTKRRKPIRKEFKIPQQQVSRKVLPPAPRRASTRIPPPLPPRKRRASTPSRIPPPLPPRPSTGGRRRGRKRTKRKKRR